jgi:POT family proton-dependent oligopeptide transporter
MSRTIRPGSNPVPKEAAATTDFPPLIAAQEPGRLILGHPPGLFLLFLVEMWERFSYYGMRGLLVLYLIRPITGDEHGFNPGRGWSQSRASVLYGWYTGLAYLTPILGGLIADRLIGTHRSMVAGGLMIALGHIVLALSGIGDLAQSHAGMSMFVLGLALIVVGTGHFKPSVSVMVGQLYPPGDPRRDGAFTIFYMGINLGAFLCAFVAGTLGEKVGWHWGFGAAAVGMIAGLVLYVAARPTYLSRIGLPPPGKGAAAPVIAGGGILLSIVFALAYYVGALDRLGFLMSGTFGLVLAVVASAWTLWFIFSQPREDRGPVATIFIFMLFNAFFWLAFEQAGSSINVFTEQKTDRMLMGWEVPATWFQSINAGLIFIMAPLFAMIWSALGRRRLNPSQPVKISLGLLFLGFGYLFMVWAGRSALTPGVKASLWLIVATYFWHTVGELCLSPTGLSYVTKVSPVRLVSFLMGIWFISSFIANLGGGLVASRVEAIEKGEQTLPWKFGGQADFFFLFVVSSVGAGVLILILTPLLKKLIAGREDDVRAH